MKPPDHPALRPTRYHWAAGTDPLHWVPALGAWIAALLLGLTAPFLLTEALLRIIPLILLAALAWSGWWLIGVPMLPRYRRLVDSRLLAQHEWDYDFQIADLLPRIDPDLHGKVQDISALRNQARRILADKFDPADPFAKDNLAKLDRLAINYLQLLAALTEHANYLSLVSPDSIEQDLDEARAELAAAAGTAADERVGESAAPDPDPDGNVVLAARSKQVELLQNRHEQYKKAQQRRELIRAQCQNVETTMKLLIDQAMTAKDPRRVGQDIDQVLSNIKESELLSEELGQLDALSSSLGERTR
jgi:hypothetical protein